MNMPYLSMYQRPVGNTLQLQPQTAVKLCSRSPGSGAPVTGERLVASEFAGRIVVVGVESGMLRLEGGGY